MPHQPCTSISFVRRLKYMKAYSLVSRSAAIAAVRQAGAAMAISGQGDGEGEGACAYREQLQHPSCLLT